MIRKSLLFLISVTSHAAFAAEQSAQSPAELKIGVIAAVKPPALPNASPTQEKASAAVPERTDSGTIGMWAKYSLKQPVSRVNHRLCGFYDETWRE
jgi:hypothetical protein